MNIGDKIFLLYTNRKTKETSCDGGLMVDVDMTTMMEV